LFIGRVSFHCLSSSGRNKLHRKLRFNQGASQCRCPTLLPSLCAPYYSCAQTLITVGTVSKPPFVTVNFMSTLCSVYYVSLYCVIQTLKRLRDICIFTCWTDGGFFFLQRFCLEPLLTCVYCCRRRWHFYSVICWFRHC